MLKVPHLYLKLLIFIATETTQTHTQSKSWVCLNIQNNIKYWDSIVSINENKKIY